MQNRTARWLLGVAALAALAACSSAPPPQALTQEPTVGPSAPAPGGTTGTTVGPATTTGGAGTSTGGGTTGATGAAPGGTATTGGAAAPGTTGGTTGSGPAAQAPLFTPAQDRIGITKDVLRLCAHAALTYGPAFNTTADDLSVFWRAINEEKGGIFGRQVEMSWVNDDYKPDVAVEAAKTCEDKQIFMLLGGIGFDQIPAVRNYVENRRLLYVHHTATVNGSAGKRYSFSMLPTVERMGEGFAQLAASKHAGKRIGILKRDSVNWEPGVTAFKRVRAKFGLNIVGEQKAAANAANYSSQLQNLKNVGVEVIWIWLNALETTQVVKQMRALDFNAHVIAFPFNLTSQALMQDALNPVMDGVAMFPAYSYRDYSGTFAAYAADMKEFEAQYARYRPNTDLSREGGDLLFLNWVGQKALYKMFLRCGQDCTRNRFVQVMTSWRGSPVSSICPLDFRLGNGHVGSDHVTFMETYQAAGGPTKVNWRVTRQCVGGS